MVLSFRSSVAPRPPRSATGRPSPWPSVTRQRCATDRDTGARRSLRPNPDQCLPHRQRQYLQPRRRQPVRLLDCGAFAVGTVVVQVRTIGSEFDYGSAALTCSNASGRPRGCHRCPRRINRAPCRDWVPRSPRFGNGTCPPSEPRLTKSPSLPLKSVSVSIPSRGRRGAIRTALPGAVGHHQQRACHRALDVSAQRRALRPPGRFLVRDVRR